MKESITNDQTYFGEDYYPWSQLLLEAALKGGVPKAESFQEFFEKYSLFESTILLFQLLAAAKGMQLRLGPDIRTLESFQADLSKLLIAVYREHRGQESRAQANLNPVAQPKI